MFVVLDDADLEKAVKIGVQARLTNAGQVCTAAKRFILHEKIADQFLSQFTEAFRKVKVGIRWTLLPNWDRCRRKMRWKH